MDHYRLMKIFESKGLAITSRPKTYDYWVEIPNREWVLSWKKIGQFINGVLVYRPNDPWSKTLLKEEEVRGYLESLSL